MSPEHRAVGWYATCQAFFVVPEDQRRAVTRQTLAHYRRIRDLPPDLGEDLDRRAAPLAIFRWVAWAATGADRRARHAFAVERHAHTGHWPSAQQRALCPRARSRAA